MKQFLTNTLTCILFISAFSISEINAQEVLIYRKDNLGNLVVLREKDSNKNANTILYIDEDWQKADVMLLGDTAKIEDVFVKVDIISNVLELKADLNDDDIKLLSIYQLKKIKFKNLAKGEIYSTQGANLEGPSGFYKLLYDGKDKLFCKYETKVIPANYNASLDVGRKEDTYATTTNYYISRNNKLEMLSTKKGKLISQLEGGDNLKAYIKQNHLNPKSERDLSEIVKYNDLNN